MKTKGKIKFTLLFAIAMLLICQLSAQNTVTVHTTGSVSDAIDLNLDWFKQLAETYQESSYSVFYNKNNQAFNFIAKGGKSLREDSDASTKENYQFGQGTIQMDNGSRLDVKYMYNKEKFKVVLNRYLYNGKRDNTFFNDGSITKTLNKDDSEGGFIVFKLDKNMLVAGYTKSDSTFMFIR